MSRIILHKLESRTLPIWIGIAATVAVSIGGILAFMAVALRNEEAAVRHRELERLKDHLTKVALSVDLAMTRVDNLLPAEPLQTAGSRFAESMRRGLVDGLIILGREGEPDYPSLADDTQAISIPEGDLWRRAQRLEFKERKYSQAAELYGELAASETKVLFRAKARMFQAACLEKSGAMENAWSALETLIKDIEPIAANSEELSVLSLQARLRLVTTATGQDRPLLESHFTRLKGTLLNYADFRLSSADRVFLFEELARHFTNVTMPITISGERLALQYLESDRQTSPAGIWSRTGLSGIWQRLALNGHCLALASTERLLDLIDKASSPLLPPEFPVMVIPPDEAGMNVVHDEIPVMNLSSNLPGWKITLAFAGSDLIGEAARQQLQFYRVTGASVVGAVLLLSIVVIRLFREQLRLMKVRNDLVSSVSHELKTPLASIRALVDSLRDGSVRDEKRYHRYLELIARENRRLTRLIENFLCFSRMERKQPQFEFEPLELNVLVREAVGTMEDRFKTPGCSLVLDLRNPLPEIQGDWESLNTVIVNLLDNAWKYTPEVKEITVTTRQRSGQVVLEVRDNGVGFDPKHARELFQPFTRAAGHSGHRIDGCGLGLSIVKFIVEAHGGSVTADRRSDAVGSIFSVRLPITAFRDEASEYPIQGRSEPTGTESSKLESNAAKE